MGIEAASESGDERSRLLLALTARAPDQLRKLTPANRRHRDRDSATGAAVPPLRLWRVSHAHHPQVAFWLICWFPPGAGTLVVVLRATDKAKLGDVFYNGSAPVNPVTDQWKRETAYEEKR